MRRQCEVSGSGVRCPVGDRTGVRAHSPHTPLGNPDTRTPVSGPSPAGRARTRTHGGAILRRCGAPGTLTSGRAPCPVRSAGAPPGEDRAANHASARTLPRWNREIFWSFSPCAGEGATFRDAHAVGSDGRKGLLTSPRNVSRLLDAIARRAALGCGQQTGNSANLIAAAPPRSCATMRQDAHSGARAPRVADGRPLPADALPASPRRPRPE